MSGADPSLTSHAMGQDIILNVACDTMPGALAKGGKPDAGGTGGHQATKRASGKATSDGSRRPVLLAKI